jgi:signal transduction histidine kinase
MLTFNRKMGLLITGCVLVLAGLGVLQYQLVRNTYQLEQASYLQQLKQQVAHRSQAWSDSLNTHAMRALLHRVEDQLAAGRRPSLNGFQAQLDQLAGADRRQLQQAFQADSMLYTMRYGLRYTQVVLYQGPRADTLWPAGAHPLRLAGPSMGLGPTVVAVGGGYQQAGFRRPAAYRLAVWNQSVVQLPPWHQAVWQRMSWLLVSSAGLLLGVALLLGLVFAALLRQKQVADITTDFANNMTHELKTPLSSAVLVSKSLRTPEARLDETWYDELLGQLDRQHDKIRRLMDTVLNSAVQPPGGALSLSLVRLSPLLAELQELARQASRELVISGEVAAEGYTDGDRLASILTNLLDNALNYTPARSRLTLRVQRTGQDATLCLSDEGPGIAPRYRRYLFTKFFRVPRPTADPVRGLGLGLYLCRQQARQLGGDLTYQPTPAGGSAFCVRLPYAPNAPAAG